eukprot:426252_1
MDVQTFSICVIRCLILLAIYTALLYFNIVNINKVHTLVWLIWSLYWHRQLSNHFVFLLIVTNLIGMNVSWNQVITGNEYLLYYSSLFALIASLLCAYFVKRKMGKSFGASGFDIKSNKNHELVTNGSFYYVRNPIYTFSTLASFVTVLSTKCHWISLMCFAVSTKRFISCIFKEEQILADVYGSKYVQYKKQTPYRLIPLVW